MGDYESVETRVPCPFCRSKSVGYSPYTGSCYCTQCMASGPPANRHLVAADTLREVAIRNWERRDG